MVIFLLSISTYLIIIFNVLKDAGRTSTALPYLVTKSFILFSVLVFDRIYIFIMQTLKLLLKDLSF